MSFWLQTLATLQLTLAWFRRAINLLRIRYFIPNMICGGYDMVLTPTGFWTPLRDQRQRDAPLVYDAVEHRVIGSREPTAWTRWQWIGAVGVSGAEYGDFFANLRVERGRILTPAQAIALAIHQTGSWPGATLRVTTRMGEEMEVLVSTGEVPPAPSSSAGAGARSGEMRYPDLDYVR
jgi:hypothetical protein